MVSGMTLPQPYWGKHYSLFWIRNCCSTTVPQHSWNPVFFSWPTTAFQIIGKIGGKLDNVAIIVFFSSFSFITCCFLLIFVEVLSQVRKKVCFSSPYLAFCVPCFVIGHGKNKHRLNLQDQLLGYISQRKSHCGKENGSQQCLLASCKTCRYMEISIKLNTYCTSLALSIR